MPFIREKEKELKKQLKYIVKQITKQFVSINKSIETKKYESVSKVLIFSEDIIELADIAFELSIENYSFAPLGKDLRRNITYTTIVKSLRDISDSTRNICKFILINNEFKINFNWLLELNEEMIKRLKSVDKLLTSESPEEARKLIKQDEKFNSLYKKNLKTFAKKIESSKSKLTTKEKEQIAKGFILSLKSLEFAADNIKEIAEMSLFISTAKLIK